MKNLMSVATILLFPVLAQAEYVFEGISATNPSAPCLIRYEIEGDRLHLKQIRGEGYYYNTIRYAVGEDKARGTETASIDYGGARLTQLGIPMISNQLLYGQKAKLVDWEYGIRSSIVAKTPETFEAPKSISVDLGASILAVRSIKRTKLKCENLRRVYED